MTDRKKSHFGAGLLAGAMLGVAAGLFLQSKKGKHMTKTAKSKVAKLQLKLMKEIKSAGVLTKDKYEELVDKVMKYYLTTKEIAKSEAPSIRAYFLDSWDRISKQLKSVK